MELPKVCTHCNSPDVRNYFLGTTNRVVHQCHVCKNLLGHIEDFKCSSGHVFKLVAEKVQTNEFGIWYSCPECGTSCVLPHRVNIRKKDGTWL